VGSSVRRSSHLSYCRCSTSGWKSEPRFRAFQLVSHKVI